MEVYNTNVIPFISASIIFDSKSVKHPTTHRHHYNIDETTQII